MYLLSSVSHGDLPGALLCVICVLLDLGQLFVAGIVLASLLHDRLGELLAFQLLLLLYPLLAMNRVTGRLHREGVWLLIRGCHRRWLFREGCLRNQVSLRLAGFDLLKLLLLVVLLSFSSTLASIIYLPVDSG